MKKLLKTLLLVCIAFSIAMSGTVLANDAFAYDASGMRTMYYLSGSISFHDGSNYVGVIVETCAFDYIDKIYHDVTIYKNGAWYLSQRYSDTNTESLSTTIRVPANDGDVIEVYVDHYTQHGSIVESGNNSKIYVY